MCKGYYSYTFLLAFPLLVQSLRKHQVWVLVRKLRKLLFTVVRVVSEAVPRPLALQSKEVQIARKAPRAVRLRPLTLQAKEVQIVARKATT